MTHLRFQAPRPPTPWSHRLPVPPSPGSSLLWFLPSSRPHLSSLLLFLPSLWSYPLPILPSSQSHLASLLMGPPCCGSHLPHGPACLPFSALPLPVPPSAPLAAQIFAAFALAGPLGMGTIHLANAGSLSNCSFLVTSQSPVFSPRSAVRPLLPHSLVLVLCSTFSLWW